MLLLDPPSPVGMSSRHDSRSSSHWGREQDTEHHALAQDSVTDAVWPLSILSTQHSEMASTPGAAPATAYAGRHGCRGTHLLGHATNWRRVPAGTAWGCVWVWKQLNTLLQQMQQLALCSRLRLRPATAAAKVLLPWLLLLQPLCLQRPHCGPAAAVGVPGCGAALAGNSIPPASMRQQSAVQPPYGP